MRPLLLGLLSAVMLTACEQAPPMYSGTVCLTVTHHGLAVAEATVYHAASRAEGPGFPADMTAAYDQEVFTELGSEACFRGLGLGRHYFAALAYDPLIRDSVLGSLALDLSVREPRVDTLLQVSEQH